MIMHCSVKTFIVHIIKLKNTEQNVKECQELYDNMEKLCCYEEGKLSKLSDLDERRTSLKNSISDILKSNIKLEKKKDRYAKKIIILEVVLEKLIENYYGAKA